MKPISFLLFCLSPLSTEIIKQCLFFFFFFYMVNMNVKIKFLLPGKSPCRRCTPSHPQGRSKSKELAWLIYFYFLHKKTDDEFKYGNLGLKAAHGNSWIVFLYLRNIEYFLKFCGVRKKKGWWEGMWKSKFSEQQVINGGSLRLLGLRKLAAGVSGLGACGKEKSKSKIAFLLNL